MPTKIELEQTIARLTTELHAARVSATEADLLRAEVVELRAINAALTLNLVAAREKGAPAKVRTPYVPSAATVALQAEAARRARCIARAKEESARTGVSVAVDYSVGE